MWPLVVKSCFFVAPLLLPGQSWGQGRRSRRSEPLSPSLQARAQSEATKKLAEPIRWWFLLQSWGNALDSLLSVPAAASHLMRYSPGGESRNLGGGPSGTRIPKKTRRFNGTPRQLDFNSAPAAAKQRPATRRPLARHPARSSA